MPRVVNHEARRRELAEAILELIRRSGLQGVTIRQIAERAGWSSGAIRHYLPNREAMLNFAAKYLLQNIEKRLQTVSPNPDHRQYLLELLLVMLPLDDQTRAWMEIWLAFVGAAISDATFADTQGITYRMLNQFICAALGEFAALGLFPEENLTQAALELQALLDGLCVHLLLYQITPEQARSALENALERLIQPPLMTSTSQN